MEINEKLLRQIIEEVISEMGTATAPVSFSAAPGHTAQTSAPQTGNGFLTEIGEAKPGTNHT